MTMTKSHGNDRPLASSVGGFCRSPSCGKRYGFLHACPLFSSIHPSKDKAIRTFIRSRPTLDVNDPLLGPSLLTRPPCPISVLSCSIFPHHTRTRRLFRSREDVARFRVTRLGHNPSLRKGRPGGDWQQGFLHGGYLIEGNKDTGQGLDI